MSAGLKLKDAQDGVLDLLFGNAVRAERVDMDAHRLGMPDGVSELHLAFRGETGCHNILGNIAAHVSGAAIDLGGILPRKGPSAVAAHPSVSIDDDLASGEAAVPLRPPNHEAPGGIDEILRLRCQK